MKKRILLILAIICLINTQTNAQETGTDKLGSWGMFFGNMRLTDTFSISPEVQYRTYEFGSNFNQLLMRNGFNWHITDKAIATFGYAHIITDVNFEEPIGEQNAKEHRLYGQFVSKTSVHKLQFYHRYRLEQRFLESSTGAKDTQYRARYFLRLTYPINDQWYATAYDEIFINLQNSLFGQNRLYAAIGYKWSENLRTEMGYLKNHFATINFDRFQLGFFYNLDLRKTD